jgi:Mg2+ transporter (mgtE)
MNNFKEIVLTYIKTKKIDELKKLLNKANELDIINIIDEMSNEEIALVYRLLNKDLALEVFEGLDVNDQQNLIKSLTEKDAIEVFKELAPDDRVRLLDELPTAVAKRLLASISREEREDVNLLMGFELETAGRLMTTEYVRLRKEWTAEEALEKIRAIAKEKETIYTLFVTNESRKLEGVISLREVLVADKGAQISDIMDSDVISFHTDTDQEEVATSLQKLDLLAVPIVDKEERLVGIITVDDAMDILQDEATEDLYIQAGLTSIQNKETNRSKTLIEGTLFQILKVRLPILILVLAGGFLAGMIVEGFEEVLNSIVAVSFFVPLIMDMGGSVGGQSTTIFARGVALGHIKTGRFFKQFFKEAMVGLSIGAIVGVLAFLVVSVWLGDPRIGLAVGFALVANCLVASMLGFFVPFVLIKIGADQAAGSGPIITSIKDITGLLIYFALVSLFLGHLM